MQRRTTSVEECDRILRDLNRALEHRFADIVQPRRWGVDVYSLFLSPPHRPPKEDERDELLVADLQQQLEVIAS